MASFTLWTNLIHDTGPKDSGTTSVRVGARQAACRRREKSEYYGWLMWASRPSARPTSSVLGVSRLQYLCRHSYHVCVCAGRGGSWRPLGQWPFSRGWRNGGERLQAPTHGHHDETRQLMVARQGLHRLERRRRGRGWFQPRDGGERAAVRQQM